jgi:hypothetical protein
LLTALAGPVDWRADRNPKHIALAKATEFESERTLLAGQTSLLAIAEMLGDFFGRSTLKVA